MTGGGIGLLTARYTGHRTARAGAASKLRAAFIPELVAMKFDRNDKSFDTDRLLRAASRAMLKQSKNTGFCQTQGSQRLR